MKPEEIDPILIDRSALKILKGLSSYYEEIGLIGSYKNWERIISLIRSRIEVFQAATSKSKDSATSL